MGTEQRLEALETTLTELEDMVMTHAEQLNRIEKNTSDLIETFQAFQGAWKVLNWIGKAAKPLALISAALGGFWYGKDHILK